MGDFLKEIESIMGKSEDPFDSIDRIVPGLGKIKEDLGETIWEKDEVPLSFRDFLESSNFLNNSILLTERQYEICENVVGWEHCPTEIFDPSKKYQELWMEITKGGGKTEMAVCIMAYVIYILQSLRNPRAFLSGKPVEEQIYDKNFGDAWIMVIGSSFKQEQALNVLFSRLREKIKGSPWFNRNFRLLLGKAGTEYLGADALEGEVAEAIKKEKEEKNLPFVYFSKDSITFPKKVRILIITGNPESGEGGDIIFFYMDEASGFQSLGGTNAAHKVHDKLQSSATTRFPGRYIGVISSYRRYVANDYMHDLILRAQSGKDSYAYGISLKGWELLPENHFSGFVEYRSRNNPDITLDIPIEWKSLIEGPDYASKEMQFLGIPPLASSEGGPFVTNLELLDEMFDSGVSARVLYSEEIEEIEGRRYATLKPRTIIPPIFGENRKYIVTYDTSKWHNRTVMMMLHKEMVKRAIFDDKQRRRVVIDSPQVVIDAILAWHPDKNDGVEVSLDNLYDVIVGISRTFEVSAVASDNWAPSLPERLHRAGIHHVNITSSSGHWHPVKELIHNKLIRVPGEYYGTRIGNELIGDFKRLEINHRSGKIGQSKQYTRVSPDYADCIKVGVHLFITNQELVMTETQRVYRPGGVVFNPDQGLPSTEIFRGDGTLSRSRHRDGEWDRRGTVGGRESIGDVMKERMKNKYGKKARRYKPGIK